MLARSGTALQGPDFFLVGAPKCGTTAMADYLSQHPEIGMCRVKETQKFAGDAMWRRFPPHEGRRRVSDDEYLQLFREAQGRNRIGEASVWYLYSPAAATEINAYSPGAEIIAMLRNPLEMLPSLHSQFVFVGVEPEEDFERALALDEERERLGPPQGFPPDSYRAAVRYAEQLERYFDVFGRERVHVIIYDDFKDDALATYQETCAFLDVSSDFVADTRVVNANKQVKSGAIRRLVRRPPEPLRKAVRAASSQWMRRRAGLALIRWNARVTQRAPLSKNVIDALRPTVEREAVALEALLGVDLRSWVD